MKKFLSITIKSANVCVFFAPIVLFIVGILYMSQSINAQSALDGFNPNANAKINAIVVQPDGKIIIGGDFTNRRRQRAQSHRPFKRGRDARFFI